MFPGPALSIADIQEGTQQMEAPSSSQINFSFPSMSNVNSCGCSLCNSDFLFPPSRGATSYHPSFMPQQRAAVMSLTTSGMHYGSPTLLTGIAHLKLSLHKARTIYSPMSLPLLFSALYHYLHFII